jgi:hypothetical protein
MDFPLAELLTIVGYVIVLLVEKVRCGASVT